MKEEGRGKEEKREEGMKENSVQVLQVSAAVTHSVDKHSTSV